MQYLHHTVNERGAVLAITMWLIVALTLLGSTVSLVVTTNTRVGKNAEIGLRTFYGSESGAEEARARLRRNYPNSPIVDDANPGDSTSLTWNAYVGSATDAAAIDYDSSNTDHTLYASLQTTFDYAVKIEHSRMCDNDPVGGPFTSNCNDDGSGCGGGTCVVARWGDPDSDQILTKNATEGENIFIITSYGKDTGANRTTQIEAGRYPPVVAPGVVYVETQINVLGSSTHVLGMDQCGGQDVPGIATTLPNNSDVDQSGNPEITGAPPIQLSSPDINVQEVINRLKRSPDFSYSYSGNQTFTGTSNPGPGQGWGTPTPGATLQNNSTCAPTDMNIVYVNMQNTYELKLSGGVTGCGFLLVEGDLQLHGDFFWYGTILVTGSVTFTGGGNKNVTGYVMAEGSVDVDVVGGNANIINCSAVSTLLRSTQPLAVLRWLEALDG